MHDDAKPITFLSTLA